MHSGCEPYRLGMDGRRALAIVGAVYMLARVAHGLGMDGGSLEKGRGLGVMVTMLTQIGLAIVAVLVATGMM